MARGPDPGAFRLLPFRAEDPAWNMAVDGALLALAAQPTLRLYGWDPPAVSLGWFQRGMDCAEFRRAGYAVVQRMTGGGAVVHHHELTYALLVPVEHELVAGSSTAKSYARIHQPIVAALREIGVTTEERVAPEPGSRERDTMCFARATHLDLLANGRKLVGSAQRRRPGWILQHGSIILATNPLQRETAAVNDLIGRPVTASQLAEVLTRTFARNTGPLVEGALSPAERDHAAAHLHEYQVV